MHLLLQDFTSLYDALSFFVQTIAFPYEALHLFEKAENSFEGLKSREARFFPCFTS